MLHPKAKVSCKMGQEEGAQVIGSESVITAASRDAVLEALAGSAAEVSGAAV